MTKKTETPNFFRSSNLLMLLLAMQLLVFVFWLVSDSELKWQNLGLYSIYCLWLVFLSIGFAMLLDRLTPSTKRWNQMLLWIIASTLAILIVESCASYVLSKSATWWPSKDRFLRFWFAEMLVLLVLARGWRFFLRVKRLDRAEAESRMQALQLRIQPHFLFNSLNTIAELTATAPKQAEEAIQSLAMLFRVSLENQNIQHSLKNEITLCKRFVDLEAWRFSGGLNVDFDVTMKSTSRWLVPKLLLQPLIENAIKYGASSAAKDSIKVIVSETSKSISVKVVNSIVPNTELIAGNGIALNNIKDRLDALYDDRYTFSSREADGSYYVLVQIPKVKASSKAK